MESGVSTEKSKIMTNSMNSINAGISMKGQKLEEVTSFKFLGATLCKDGTCSAEVRIRFASAVSAMARLNRIWRCNTISFANKFKVCKSLVNSILLYGCETWTLLADSENDVAHPAFSLPTTASPILQGPLKDGFVEAVVGYDIPKPSKFPSLDSCQKRFLWTHTDS